jgi:hypothetical protein
MASWLAQFYDHFDGAAGVLYCSPECAKEDGRRKGRYISRDEYDQPTHGALCPVCEREYEEF